MPNLGDIISKGGREYMWTGGKYEQIEILPYKTLSLKKLDKIFEKLEEIQCEQMKK